MATVTICSDFEAQKIKSDTVSTKPLDYSKLADIEQEEKEAPGKFLDRLRVKEETDRTGSILKAGLHLGLDCGIGLDCGLYAQYLWK